MRRKVLSSNPMSIPPKLTLRGTQLAGWAPKHQPGKATKGILFDEDVEIALPDGTMLLADLFRPFGSGPVPALVSWATYIKDTERLGGGPLIDESGVCPFTICSGYAIIRIQPRGTGRSGGRPPEEMFSPQERQDCHDCIEWVSRQPWCNGVVGMTGMSAFGISQLLTASTRPPHLKAIFPYKAMSDPYRQGFYKGGAPYSGAIELFTAFEKMVPPKLPSWLRHAFSYVLNYRWFAFETSAPRKTEKAVRRFMRKNPPPVSALDSYISRTFDRAFDDGDYWRSKSVYAVIDRIEIPVCIATDYGAQGFHFYGAFELWHRLNTEKFLFVGPPEYHFPWSNYQRELVAWYDWQLKGIENGYASLPRVRYWLRGAERWEGAGNWPIPAARPLKLHLAAGEGDGRVMQSLTPDVPGESRVSYLARSTNAYAPPGFDERAVQVLRYQTQPYASDARIVGPVALQLTLSATAIDTYVVARLSDVAPDGSRAKLAWGWLMASRRSIDEARSNPTEIVHHNSSDMAEQLVPGQPTQIRFSLTPIANMFKAGHRLELEVTSQPDLIYSEAGEGFDMFCWDPVPYPSRNHVHHGGLTPSVLEVSILRS